MSVVELLGVWRADVVPPLTPDGDEARRWAEQELSDPAYDIAQPTPLDRFAQAIGHFIGDLFNPRIDGTWGTWLAVIAGLVVVALIVTAFLVWGRPRAQLRGRASTAELFGEDETRSADELRRAAVAHARREEWDAAIVLRFRALARGLGERGVVETPPGTTVHGFARTAARAFPSSATDLEGAATAFDDVRYLRRPGTGEMYRGITATDEALARARSAVAEVVA